MQKARNQSKELDCKGGNTAQLKIAQPDTNCCQICKISFSSYIEHIEDETHKKKVHESQANSYILELSEKYGGLRMERTQKPKNKMIKKGK